MKNVKLKIKNGTVDETVEGGESPVKSGVSEGCVVDAGSDDGSWLMDDGRANGERKKGEIDEKANENCGFRRSFFSFQRGKGTEVSRPNGDVRSAQRVPRGQGKECFFDGVPRVGRFGKRAANPGLNDATPLELFN